MKRHKYQLAALMMSVIIATGSLSGSVFAAETSGDTAESSVVEEIEESEQSETEDEKADEDSGNESDQETEKLEEDTTQQTEKSVKDAENAEEQGLSIPAEIGNNSEKEKEDLSSGSVNTPTEKNDTKGAVEDKRKTTEGEDKAVIDIPVEQETVIIDEESEKGFSSLDFESDQNEIIPEETVEMHVGERYNAVSYSHEDNESVRFEIDPNLPIGLLGVIDVADGYTTKHEKTPRYSSKTARVKPTCSFAYARKKSPPSCGKVLLLFIAY